MKQIRILRTPINMMDKPSAQYLKSIEKYAKENGYDTVLDEQSSIKHDAYYKTYLSFYPNTIILEPSGVKYDKTKTLDNYITAQVVTNIVSNLIDIKHVTILGRGETVGEPLRKMLNDINKTVTVLHSKSGRYISNKILNITDIVIDCTNNDRNTRDLSHLDCMLINVSGALIKAHYSYNHIGQETTKLLFKKLEELQ